MRIRQQALLMPLILGCATLSGCSLLLAPHKAGNTADSPAITQLLFYSRALMLASPSERHALLETAKDAYTRHPTALTTARLGLAYGQPDYKGYSPHNGQRYTKKALALDTAYWGSAATTYLSQFAALSADNADVRDQLSAAQKHADKLKHRLAEERQHNQKITQQLVQARRKLYALTRIENRLNP